MQQESGTQFWKDGCSTEENLTDYVVVVKNTDYFVAIKKGFRVYRDKLNHRLVIEGHANEVDSLNRRITFSFFIENDNIHESFKRLEKTLNNLGYTLNENEVQEVLSPYVKQNVIPFLTKKNAKKLLCVCLVVIAVAGCLSMTFCLTSGNSSAKNHIENAK